MSYETVLLPKWLSHQGIILAKEQFHNSYTFWAMPILIFGPVYLFMRHPLYFFTLVFSCMSTTAYLLRRWSCTNSTMKEKNKHLLENIWLYVSCKDVQLLFSVFYFCMFHKCILCLLLKLSYYATFSFRNVDLFPKNCILHYVVNWFFEPFWTNST